MKEKLETAERVLRRILWDNHGCYSDMLNGEAGEMFCRRCDIDFLRYTLERIERKLEDLKVSDGRPVQINVFDFKIDRRRNHHRLEGNGCPGRLESQ